MYRVKSLIVAMSLSVLAAACGSKDADASRDNSQSSTAAAIDTPAPEVERKELSIDELAALLDEKGSGSVVLVDSNNSIIRDTYGVIPGATVLTHYRNYQVSELPRAKNTKLVFYCANHMCTSAGAAADKAILAGYSDVNTLPAGIMGWSGAGKQVSAL